MMIGAYADYAGVSGGGGGGGVQPSSRFNSESRLELLVNSSSSSGVVSDSFSFSVPRRRFKTRSSTSLTASNSSEITSSSRGSISYARDSVTDVLWKAPASYKTRRHRAAAFRDFVLITEFSEIEGPVPLLTIPEDTKLDTRRLNDLAVRLMSTDYQSRAGSHSSVAPDAQVYQTNLLPNIHALANYVTLCDIRARGFVRPLCIAYITGDDLKIPTVLPEVRAKLVEASEMIKHTNRIWFEEELTVLLADLRHTKEEYVKWQSNKSSVNAVCDEETRELLDRINLESLAAHISECELMLFGLDPCLNDEKARKKVTRWRKAVENGDVRFGSALVRLFSQKGGHKRKGGANPSLIAPSPVKRTFESIRPFQVLCQWGLLPAIEILHKFSARLSAPTQCLKFLKQEEFFGGKHVPREFTVNLNIGLLDCLATDHPKLEDQPETFDQECLNFLESWTGGVLKQCFADAQCRRSLTHTFDGFITGDAGPSANDDDICLLTEKYYVDHSSSTSTATTAFSSRTSLASSISCEPPPVSQILSRDEVLELKTDDLPAYMEELNTGDAGWCLGTFFHLYSGVAYHVLFSLLSGRPVIIAGPQASESTVVEIVRALEAFLPRRSRVLRWHTGIVSDFHTQTYQLIGLCVPERLCVQDMMCSATLNRVTVLNTDNQHIFGPAYSGTLLETLAHVRVKKAFASDKVIMSQIYAVLVNVARKVFLCFALTKEGRLKLKEVMAALGLENCDRQIVRYLLDWSKS